MKKYKKGKLVQIYCNKCGRELVTQNGIVKEGDFHIEYRWDYFSRRDGIKHSFDMCEECYEKMIKEFKYPVLEEQYTEFI